MGTGVFIKGRGEAARLRGRLFSSRLTSRLRFARRQDSLGAAEECRKNRYIQAASLVTSSKRTRVISRECRSQFQLPNIECDGSVLISATRSALQYQTSGATAVRFSFEG